MANSLHSKRLDFFNGKRKKLYLTGSGAAASALVIPSTLVEDYASVSVQCSGTFVGTLSLQVSNDGSDWIGVRMQKPDNTDSMGGGFTTPGALRGDLGFRYFRAIISAYTSGTINANAFFSQASIAPQFKTTYPPS